MQTQQQGLVMDYSAVRPVGSYRTEDKAEATPLAFTKTRLLLAALLSAGLLWLCYFPMAWGWLGWMTPALLLVLFFTITGIPPTEEQALRSRGEDYRRYQQETSIFVPWFPKRS